jgi:LmbE family N-acetylglucosaminyl deacetylase
MTEVNQEFGWSEQKIKRRDREIEKVHQSYGFQDRFELGCTATKLDECSIGDIVGSIKSVLDSIEPEVLLIPSEKDIHTDHQITFQTVLSASKSFRSPYIKKIMCYECLSETEYSPPTDEQFNPNVYVNISDYIEGKIEIMNIYSSEMMEPPGPRSERSLRALAKFRGSRALYNHGEAFELVQEFK